MKYKFEEITANGTVLETKNYTDLTEAIERFNKRKKSATHIYQLTKLDLETDGSDYQTAFNDTEIPILSKIKREVLHYHGQVLSK